MALSDAGFIAVALISQIGMLISLLVWQAGWFKKEAFKVEMKNTTAVNKIKLDQLRKEMGLTKAKPTPPETPGKFDTLANLLPILRTLDPDQLGALADRFLGDEPIEGGSNVTDLIMQFAESNPELVKSFLEGMSAKKEGTTEAFPTQ